MFSTELCNNIIEGRRMEQQLGKSMGVNNLQVQKSTSNIGTMVRLRPLLRSEQDQKQSIFVKEKNTIEIRMIGGKRQESVEHVFSHSCTQREVFEEVKPIIARCGEGFNVTVFTYGQTGSGKTYTMFGSDWNNILRRNSVASENSHQPPKKEKQSTFLRSLEQDENHAGLIPRTIHLIFNSIVAKRPKHIKVYCSFLQLYNEQMMDLFEDDRTQLGKKMLIHQNKTDGIYVEGLNEIEVSNMDHCLELMQRGERNRVVRQTHMNVKSSRSHTIFQLLIEEVFPADKSYRRMKVNLCDLAGSEKINKSEQMQQDHFEELKNINLSLTTLGKVIGSLSLKNKAAPFRESKLTRLLQDSLGGNTHTAIIATITSKSSCLEESLNTLKFLERAKQIKTSLINKVFHENPEMRNLEKEIAYLKDILKMKRTGVEIDVDMTDKFKKLQSENQKLKQMVDKELVDRLMRENLHLKKELQRKAADGFLERRTVDDALEHATDGVHETDKFSTIDPSGRSEDMRSGKDRMERNDKISLDLKVQSDAASSYSSKKVFKERKMMSTKTYTVENGEGRSTGKTSSKLFPSIRSIGPKNTPTSILERIHEIQRVKQANKLKLQHQLAKIGQSESLNKNTGFGRSSRYPPVNSRYSRKP